MLRQMNERIKQLAEQAFVITTDGKIGHVNNYMVEQFAESIVRECVNREELLSAIARGWCSEKNSHKIMDSDLALAIFDEVEQQIKQHFGVKE
jgi:hypothetical protein